MREPERYRECLKNILAYSNGKRILNKKEVEQYLGKGRKWCNSNISYAKSGITVESLAMCLAKM